MVVLSGLPTGRRLAAGHRPAIVYLDKRGGPIFTEVRDDNIFSLLALLPLRIIQNGHRGA